MLKRSLYLVTTLLVVIGMLGVSSPAFALTTTQRASGRVIAMNRRTHVMVIRTLLGSRVRLRYGLLTTRLWHNGVRISLSRLHVGNVVSAAYTPSALIGMPGTAGDVNDNNGLYEVSGTVAAVDTTLNTVSIASHEGGSTVVLNVNASTVITRNGAPATLADLVFGDQVEAKYDSATMTASYIKVEDTAQQAEIEGSITAVDTTLGTVTISGEGDGGSGSSSGDSFTPMDVTVNVTTSTVIMLDGSPVPLSMLQVGMQAEAQYDPTSMNANFLEAESQSGQ